MGLSGSIGRDPSHNSTWNSKSSGQTRNQNPIALWTRETGGTIGQGGKRRIVPIVLAMLAFLASVFSKAFKKVVDGLEIIWGKSKPAFGIIVLVVLLVLGGAVDSVAHVGKVYGHVNVGDIEAGGLTRDELHDQLMSRYGKNLAAGGVTVYASEDDMKNHAVNPQDSGDLSPEEQAKQTVNWSTDKTALQAYIDYQDIVDQAMAAGRGGIFDRLSLFFFKRTIDVDVNYNEAIVDALAAQMDMALGYSYVNSEMTVDAGVASASESKDGMMVDRGELKSNLTAQLLSDNAENREFFVVAVPTPAQISTETGKEAADRANHAIEHGVNFHYGDTSWSVDKVELGSWVSTHIITGKDGKCTLNVYIDPMKARPDISQHAKATFENGDETVKFEKNGDDIQVKLSSTGTMPLVNPAISALNDRILGDKADTSSTPEIAIDSTDVPTDMYLNEALNTGVVSVIGEYTTEYTSGATERNHNIHLAADLLNNSITEANGGVWSFNKVAGECNEEKGFQAAGSIVGDELLDEIGGGICQVGTTVFNSVYEVGLPIVERHNHSMYISSYPAGRDAAINWPDLDLQWKNDTTSDILLKTSYTDTSLTVTLYGISPGNTVTTETGAWEEGEKHKTIYRYDDSYSAGYSYVKNSGSDGQSITVTRTVKDKSGRVVNEDTFASVYQPTDQIIVRGGTQADWAGQ